MKNGKNFTFVRSHCECGVLSLRNKNTRVNGDDDRDRGERNRAQFVSRLGLKV